MARPLTYVDGADPQLIAANLNAMQDGLLQVPAVQATTSPYTLVADDAGRCIEVNAATQIAVVVPNNSAVAFPVGTVIGVDRMGTGDAVIFPDTGVTIR